MASSEFTRIVRDLSQLGDSVCIEVSKEGIRFGSEGEATNGSVLFWQGGGAISCGKITAVKEEAVNGEEVEGSTIEFHSCLPLPLLQRPPLTQLNST